MAQQVLALKTKVIGLGLFIAIVPLLIFSLVANELNRSITQQLMDASLLSQADIFEAIDVNSMEQFLYEVVESSDWISNVDAI